MCFSHQTFDGTLIIRFIFCRPGVRNAIQIADLLLKEQMLGSSLLGRIPPRYRSAYHCFVVFG